MGNNSKPIAIPKTGRCEECGKHGVTHYAHYSSIYNDQFGGGMGCKVNGILISELCPECHHDRDNPKIKDFDSKIMDSEKQMKMILLRLAKAYNDGILTIKTTK